jgi:hypothetical protein
METKEELERRFAQIGAKVRVRTLEPPGRDLRRRALRVTRPFDPREATVDYRNGQYVVSLGPDADVKVLDVRPKEKHLVLMTNSTRMLVGHDERDWFVAAVPGAITTVQQARDRLKPPEVRAAEKGLKRDKSNKRRNGRTVRQGEWFFVPAPEFAPTEIHRNEPIARSRGGRMASSHICEELCRAGGQTVYQFRAMMYSRSQNELDAMNEQIKGVRALVGGQPATEAARARAVSAFPQFADDRYWTPWVVGMDVYVRGAVRHPDHATVKLAGWHRVLGNTEDKVPGHAARAVLFVD